MEKVDENIKKWSEMFDKYIEIESNSTMLLNKLMN